LAERLVDRLKAVGFKSFDRIDDAGRESARSAYQRTFSDATDPLARREFGALIVECGGKYLSPPGLTEGFSWTQSGGQPYVNIPTMQGDLLQAILNARDVRPELCGIVGVIHSHPMLDGFDDADKQRLDNYRNSPPASRVRFRLERSYLWAPRPHLGGNDSEGQLYTYP
jgi:hypothetical protein